MAPSAYTLAEDSVYPNGWVRAIYAGEQPVGLLALVTFEDGATHYHLARLLIGAQYQGLGFGSRAIELLADHVRTLPGARCLETSCQPDAAGPIGFYRSLGFEETGEQLERETLLRLAL